MMSSDLSVLGLWYDNPAFLDAMQLPVGVDRDTLVNNLLAELGELELLYPDGEFMAQFVGVWSAKQLPVWEKLYATTLLEYNPIENYDRNETVTETIKNTGTVNTELDSDSKNKVAGFNDEELRETSSTTGNNSGTTTNNLETTITRTNHTHGNIGVTTSQQMLMSEREIAEFNIIDYIINDFKMRFCILVY